MAQTVEEAKTIPYPAVFLPPYNAVLTVLPAN